MAELFCRPQKDYVSLGKYTSLEVFREKDGAIPIGVLLTAFSNMDDIVYISDIKVHTQVYYDDGSIFQKLIQDNWIDSDDEAARFKVIKFLKRFFSTQCCNALRNLVHRCYAKT